MDDWMRYYGGAAAVEAAGGHQARADAYQAGQVWLLACRTSTKT